MAMTKYVHLLRASLIILISDLFFPDSMLQLLHILNLDSPAPSGHKVAFLTLHVQTSPSFPYFSPASVSLALLKVTDLSPGSNLKTLAVRMYVNFIVPSKTLLIFNSLFH